jgi:hypothetical protein
MSTSSTIINESMKKIRRHWLFSTFSFLVLYPFALFGFYFALSKQYAVDQDILVNFLKYGITGILQMLIIWHCAYRKFGTKLLTFWLAIGSSRVFVSIIECLNDTWNIWMFCITHG